MVYAATGSGVYRKSLNGTGGPPVSITLDNATHVILTDNYVVWRRGGGELRSKPKGNPDADAGILYAGASNTNSIHPRVADQFLIVRNEDVYACGGGGGACAGDVLVHAGVQDVLPRGSSFDFTAADVDGVAVFQCTANCTQPEAGTRFALGGQVVPDLASNDDFLFWIDKGNGRVRRVPRMGGVADDVMTNLVAPVVLALDNQGRVVVGTEANGVFRGPANGRCTAPPGPSEQVRALTFGPAGGVMATDTQIKTLRP